MSVENVAILLGLALALTLALGNFRGSSISLGSKAKLALVWVIIIAGLAVVIDRFT